MNTSRNLCRTARMLAIGLAATIVLAGCQQPSEKTAPPPDTAGFMQVTPTFDMTQDASPEDIYAALAQNKRVVLRGNVLFATDSAMLQPSGLDAASRLAAALTQDPDLNVAVVGHTDDTGPFRYNLQLSQQRAQSFAKALVNAGVAEDRIAPVGVGPLSPVASNDTPEGQQMNRRVEVVVAR